MSIAFQKQDALSYFSGDELPAKVFLDKYALRDNNDNLIESTPNDMHKRIARELARVERKKFKKPLTTKQIYSLLKDFKYIIPQGSPMYGIGNPRYISLSNCYVIQPPYDSYGGIHYTDEQITQISKRRGGVGTDISAIRPGGMPTLNSSRYTTGIVPFMQRWSNSIREVGQDGRRGALMLTISVHHPQVLDFASVKLNKSVVTGANLSVRLTDEFLNAVDKDEVYEQRWPVDSQNPEIRKLVRARDVWDRIIELAWTMAEPGLLFWDRIIKESPADCYADFGFKTVSTNPCSELPLSILDSCRLLLLNLFGFVENPFTKYVKFNFKKFFRFAELAQRLMDDIIDLELECIQRIIDKIKADPEPEFIKERELNIWIDVHKNCATGRRTGTGITALADAMAATGIQYGSARSMVFAEQIYRTLKLGCYTSSIKMAKELGPFPIWNPELEANHPFLDRVIEDCPELGKEMQKYGRRNIALLTTAPAGSTSILAGPGPYFGTSSSGEPVYMLSHIRKKKINLYDTHSRIDFTDDNGDRWMEFEVFHPKARLWMDITGSNDLKNSPYHGCTAYDINWKERVRLQAIAQDHIDHAISSCVVGDTFLYTEDGIYTFEELCSLVSAQSFGKINSNTVLKSININNVSSCLSEAYNNGLAEVFRINLNGGSSITCTANHKLACLNNDYSLVWKMVSKLTTEDIIVGRKGLNLWNKDNRHQTLNAIVGKDFVQSCTGNCKNIKLPTHMSEQLARLLGYMCSDGSVGINGISLCQQKNNVCDDFITIIKDLFEEEVNWSNDNRSNNLYNLVVNSRKLRDYFKWLGITNHDEIRVPKCIRFGTRTQVIEFIRGVTLDGYVSKGKVCVATSISIGFLQDLKFLLNNFGITAIICNSNKPGTRLFPSGKVYATKACYALLISNHREIEKYLNIIGFAEDRKNDESKRLSQHSARIKVSGEIPDYGLRKRFREDIINLVKSNHFYTYLYSLIKPSNDGRLLNRESIVELMDFGLEVNPILVNETYEFNKIKSIEQIGLRQTYDVSVPDGHSYIANGLISHNTINLPSDVSQDEVATIYETAWKAGCKGITVYRNGCRDGVMIEKKKEKCPQCEQYEVIHENGCAYCKSCGWSICKI
jgi:ribonucleotide reductase alpha subunit/intein/homing endonuclease